MNADNELDLWRQQWQAQATVPLNLRESIDRQTRTMRVLLAAEIAVTVIFGGGSVLASIVLRRADVTVLTAGIWVFIAVAWTFSQANRRGTWKPVTATTVAFLDLVILRAYRRLQAIKFTGVSYIVFLAFNLGWVYREHAPQEHLSLSTFLTSGLLLGVWAVTALLGFLALWHRRKITEQLSHLTELRNQLRD